jgi:hypothetical protein
MLELLSELNDEQRLHHGLHIRCFEGASPFGRHPRHDSNLCALSKEHLTLLSLLPTKQH